MMTTHTWDECSTEDWNGYHRGQGPSRNSFGATNLIKKITTDYHQLVIILSLLTFIGEGKEIQKAGAQYYGASWYKKQVKLLSHRKSYIFYMFFVTPFLMIKIEIIAMQSLSLPKLAIFMDKLVQQSQREEMYFWQMLREKRYLTRSNPFPAVLWRLTPSTDSPPAWLTITRGELGIEESPMIRTLRNHQWS